MAPISSPHPRSMRWLRASPWVVIGSVCILAGIMGILAVKNVHREREYMVRTLLSEADILMRSLEAISRNTMMRMGWGRSQIQSLMEDAADQPDVLYVALATSRGVIVAHSRPELVGTMLDHPPPPGDKLTHRFVNDGDKAFEVSRAFQSSYRSRRGMHRAAAGNAPACATPASEQLDKDLYIVVGMDPTPFEHARQEDLQQMALLFGVLFIGGVAGLLSLVWAQSYQSVRRSLRDVEAFTSTIVNQMPVGLLAAGPNGVIQRANDAARVILKRPVGPGMDIRTIPCFIPMVERVRSEESVVDVEVQCSMGDAHEAPLLVNAALLRDGRGQPVGSVLLFSDLTGIKQLEEQLRRSERLAALGRLAAGVAHEIRNPLSSIKGFAAILAGKAGDDPQAKKIAEVMQQEVERLNGVVSELLDFARPIELHRRTVRCDELLRQTLRLVEKDAEHQGVAIGVDVAPEGLEAKLDPDRFSQVLLNLYLNALQAMENGGSLSVGVHPENEQLVWTVADSGSGVAPEHLPHVFDPYFTTKARGVGLGLAIVHKLVEAHNGDIEAESQPGRGARFIVRIPS
ncbi:MAG: ATP-binding protein [Syntrophobacteraceae bacterium]